MQAEIDAYLAHLDGLIRRGRTLRNNLADDPSSAAALASNRLWQQDVAITINQLSGGSKAHWLARAFSEAFLVRSTNGAVVEGAAPDEITGRLLEVLARAVASVSQMAVGEAASNAPEPPRRFDFVHNAELRPIVEQAYPEGRSALEQGHFKAAMFGFCGILEAIVTDALEHSGVPASEIAAWPFDARLAAAEQRGLIGRGCARLPSLARRYREISDDSVTVSEQEARQTGQVLRVVMRDLDPGR